MGSTALITAGVAAALLVVTLGVDVAMTSEHALDIWTGSAWREVVRDPVTDLMRYGPPQVVQSVNASDDVRFRLRLENGYPWAQGGEYRVLHNGEEVARGALSAQGRGSAQSEFTIPAERLLSGGGSGPYGEPKPVGGTDTFVQLQIQLDGKDLFQTYQPYFTLREVSG